MDNFPTRWCSFTLGSDVRLFLDATFPTRWRSFTLGFRCSSVFGCNISNKMVQLHTGVQMFVCFWMQHFQTGRLGEMVRHPGHHDRRISPPLDFFIWRYVKDKVFSTPVPDITNVKARITDAFATITEGMLENTWREIDYRLDVLRATKEAHVEVY